MPVVLSIVSPVRFPCGKLRVRRRNQNRRTRTRQKHIKAHYALFHALHRRGRMEMQVFVSNDEENPSSSERRPLLSSSVPQSNQPNLNRPHSESQVLSCNVISSKSHRFCRRMWDHRFSKAISWISTDRLQRARSFPATLSAASPTDFVEGCRLLYIERSGITGSSFFLASVAFALHSKSLSCSHSPSDFNSERPCHF